MIQAGTNLYRNRSFGPVPTDIGATGKFAAGRTWLTPEIHSDPDFAAHTIGSYASRQTGISEERLVDALHDALADDQRGDDAKRAIKSKLARPLCTTGALMIVAKTNAGLRLLAAESQRRGICVQSNGTCEIDESMRTTAHREVFEENGNLASGGAIASIFEHQQNLRSLAGVNSIGTTRHEIAMSLAAKRRPTFVNASELYVNRETIPIAKLEEEVAELNDRMAEAAPYYWPAVKLVYDKPKVDLTLPDPREKATHIVRAFYERCSESITDGFRPAFEKAIANPYDPVLLEHALKATIDLSENARLLLWDESEIKRAIRTYESDSKSLTQAVYEHDMLSLMQHKGTQTPDAFIAFLSA